jgi:hypothetical protein
MLTDEQFCDNFVNSLFTEFQFLTQSQVILLQVVFSDIVAFYGYPLDVPRFLERVLGWCLINQDKISSLGAFPVLKKWWNIPTKDYTQVYDVRPEMYSADTIFYPENYYYQSNTSTENPYCQTNTPTKNSYCQTNTSTENPYCQTNTSTENPYCQPNSVTENCCPGGVCMANLNIDDDDSWTSESVELAD